MVSPPVGVALFDKSLTSGWSCVSGSQPTPIINIEELGEDVFWVTNYSRKELVLAEIFESSHIAGSDYFNVSIDCILIELGLWGSPLEHQSSVLADVLHRVAGFGCSLFGASMNKKNYAHGLADSLDGFAGGEVQNNVVEMFQLLSSPGEFPSGVLGGKRKDEKIILFSLPHYSLSSSMLQTPRPQGRLKKVSEGALIPPSERVAWVERQGKCVMCEVEVSNVSQHHAQLIALSRGNRSSYKSTSIHSLFVTGPELLILDAISSVFVKSIYITDLGSASRNTPTLELDRGFHVSYSYGVFAHNLWLASLYPTKPFSIATAHSAWSIGILRARVLADAINMIDAIPSLSIKAIKYGQMLASVANDEVDRAFDRGIKAGYIPFSLGGSYRLVDGGGFSSVPHKILTLWASLKTGSGLLAEDSKCFNQVAASKIQQSAVLHTNSSKM